MAVLAKTKALLLLYFMLMLIKRSYGGCQGTKLMFLHPQIFPFQRFAAEKIAVLEFKFEFSDYTSDRS